MAHAMAPPTLGQWMMSWAMPAHACAARPSAPSAALSAARWARTLYAEEQLQGSAQQGWQKWHVDEASQQQISAMLLPLPLLLLVQGAAGRTPMSTGKRQRAGARDEDIYEYYDEGEEVMGGEMPWTAVLVASIALGSPVPLSNPG